MAGHVARVDMTQISHGTLRKWAELYCLIWKEPPWNEDFWTIEGVIADIHKGMREPSAEAFLAFENDALVGFTWGYEVSREKLREIAGWAHLDFIFEQGRVFYIDELGVDRSCRGKDLGKALSEALIERVENGHRIFIAALRTDIKAEAARGLYQRLGFKEVPIADSQHPNRTYWVRGITK